MSSIKLGTRMLIGVTCRSCGSTYRFSEQFAGRQAQCRKCGAKMVLPPSASQRTPMPTPHGLNLDPFGELESTAQVDGATELIPAPSPDDVEPSRPPRRRRPSPPVHLSESTSKMLSIALLIAWALGSLWVINSTLARVGQSLPQEMVSKLHTIAWLNFAWTTLVFFIVFVPAMLFT